MKIVAIIQARMGAHRLPDKVWADLNGQPVLTRVVNRVRQSDVDTVVVATTDNERDNVIAGLCNQHDHKWDFYRGSEEDVLDRYYQTALTYHADVIVRITADCPLIEPEIINRCVEKFVSLYPDVDYVSTLLPRTYPRGLDVEVISFETLKKQWESTTLWREHVTLNIRKNPDSYRIGNISSPTDYSYMRWTVDTPEDLEFVRKIYDFFGNFEFSWNDVLHLLDLHPDWVIRDTQVDPK
jgi:spore coat polysaccharide biosynthesis protein SpsF